LEAITIVLACFGVAVLVGGIGAAVEWIFEGRKGGRE
jgi:hypothetical protein